MKKMIVFFVATATFLAFKYYKQDNFYPFYHFDEMTVIADDQFPLGEDKIQSGDEYFYTLSREEGKAFVENIKDYSFFGFVFHYQNKDIEFLNEYDVSEKTSVEGRDVYYGYYSGYNDFYFHKGKKVNFQAVIKEDELIVGFPIILTGF